MIRRILHSLPRTVRDLVAPRYRPELYYMRGFGPACAARRAAEQTAGQPAL
jgi:hypothetical protein